MKFYPTQSHKQFLYLLFVSTLLIFSCSKDSDLLNEAIFNEAAQSIEEREAQEESSVDLPSETPENPVVVEEPVLVEDEVVELESRTTSFPTLQDAHLQSGKGYNQQIIRLEEGRRTSYLMFDISQIDSIDGSITAARLEFTIDTDSGDGTINVYKGESSDWEEHSLTEITTPKVDVLLGNLIKEYKIGATEEIDLDIENLNPEISTLVLDHEEGDDLAIASKEHPEKNGPHLIVTYEVPVGADLIVVPVSEEDIPEGQESNNENQAPIALADGSPTSGTAPLEVAFEGKNSTDDKKIESYRWDFKNGSTSGSINPTRTFTEIGTYEVMLTVTDEEGLTDSDVVTVTVTEKENEAPKAVAKANTPTTGIAPLEVQFKGSNSTDDLAVKKYKWDFKDGSEEVTNANPNHTFTEAGTFEVELTVEDEHGLTNTDTITITVTEAPENEAPKAAVSATPESGAAPLEVQFKGSSSTDDKEVVKYNWDFKDGSNSTSKNPSHTFANAGAYKVELTVEDEEGLSHSTTITINVSEPIQNDPPKAVALANPTSGTAPLEVDFDGGDSTDDDAIDSYSWDFKNGQTSSSRKPTRTFSQPGIYEVELTVRDKQGLEHTDFITITVEESEPDPPTPNADVKFWQNLFDSKWAQTKADAISLSRSKNRNQEYYYLGLYIDGLASIWQATGDNSYLDTALSLINETVDDARSVGGGFQGWPASDGRTHPLWDSHYWRQVVTILRIMHQSPNIKSSSKYKNQFNELLNFSEKNIWDRYDNTGQTHNFYRTKTHMTSHWARIGLELYLITGKSKYRQVFNNISYGSMIGRPSNLRNQMFSNPQDSNAYAWDDEWGVSYGSNIQDTSHGGAIVSMIVTAYDQGLYWKKSDINALLKTVNVVWTGPDTIKENVDGSGGNASRGRLHEWFYLARYSQSLQNRIKRDYLSNPHLNYYGCQALGIAALNSKILSDGKGVYPSN